MAAYSRTTGHNYSDDSNYGSHHSNKYSTSFSNKLIDLAISVDAEVLAVRKCSKTSSTAGMERTDINIGNSLSNCSYVDEFNDQYHGPFFNGGGSKSIVNGHSRVRDTKTDVRTFSSDSETLKYGQDVPNCSTSRNLTNDLRPSACNLLTVFSSPCTEYFPNSKRTNLGDSDDDVPEYVRMMMEKDLALKRLVKTGSVTISQVKPELGTADDEKYLDDEDFFYDDADDEGSVNEGSRRPYAPPANIEDWEDFPCAKILLKLTHISLTSSTGSSTLRRTENPNGLTMTKKPLPPPPSVIMTKVKKLPVPIVQTNLSVRKGSSSKSLNTKTTLQKHVSKTPQHSSLLKQTSKSSFISTTQFPIKPSSPKPRQSRLLSRTIAGENKVTAGLSAKKTQLGRNSFRECETFTEDPLAAFQVDPMTFLEVSLQEGKVPDDSQRRKYKCGFCEKKFCWSTDLKRHTLIHTGERPFKCPECPANFTRKFLMQKHLKKVHQPKTVTTSDNVPEEEDFSSVATLIDASFLGDPRDDESVDRLYTANGGDFEFKTEFKHEAPDDDDDSYEDFDMQGGSGDEDEIELSTKFDVSDYGQQPTNVTYLDF